MFHRQKTEENSTAPKTEEEKLETSSIESADEAVEQAESSAAQQDSVQEKKEEEPSMTDQNKETETASRSLDIPTGGSAFPQRPAAAPAPRYPATYNTAAPSASVATGDDRRLLIGPGITMSGEIDSCDVLVVEGTVEASLRGARTLDVAETGVFYGAVEIDEATVSGRFEGDIVVNGRLTITSTGSITGSIAYREMAMEAGAMIDGKVSPLSASGSAKADKPRARKAVKAASAEKASDESQLPFSGTAAAA